MQHTLLLTVFEILGGAGLFVFGMKLMTKSLEEAAGNSLKNILTKLSKNQIIGLLAGTLIAFLIHSGAATIMISSFINSGLITFQSSIGAIIGANIGTTLSMQIISFEIGKYCFVAIGAGFILEIISKNEKLKKIGLILIGFGLLFLGMETMKSAVAPFKESVLIKTTLLKINASSITSMLFGILVSTIFTMILQSSGAMIGILFAFCSTGIINDFKIVFPLLLGAHIGTCIVTIIGAIGANRSAKLAAYAHLYFNVFGAALAVIMFPFYDYIIPLISGNNLLRATANAHTIIQCLNGLIFLATARWFVKLVKLVTFSRNYVEDTTTFLDDSYIELPERGILASLQELQRMLEISRKMLKKSMDAFVNLNESKFIEVRKYEDTIDKVKDAIIEYLTSISKINLSNRQALLIQFAFQTASDIERIGDHIEKIVEITELKIKEKIWFSVESINDFIELYISLDKTLEIMQKTINPNCKDFEINKQFLKKMIIEYRINTKKIRLNHLNKIIDYQEKPFESYFFFQYLMTFDRIIKHIKSISFLYNNNNYTIKNDKLNMKKKKESPTEKNGVKAIVDNNIFL